MRRPHGFAALRVLADLARNSEKNLEMREATLRDWGDRILANVKSFCKLFKTVLGSDIVNKVAFWWPEGRAIDKPEDPTRFLCDICQYICATEKGMSWHRYHEHGLKHSLRNYIRGTTCEACLKYFRTRNRLFTHLSASSDKCNKFYGVTAFALTDEELQAQEEQAEELTRKLRSRGRRRTYAEFPPVLTDGPLHPSAIACCITHSMRERIRYAPTCSS